MFRVVLVLAIIALAYGRAPYVRPRIPPLEGRIMGGKNTTIEEHPYHLSLAYPSGVHYCSAALIRPNVALTVAQCTWGHPPTFYRIRAGTAAASENVGKFVKLLKICEHPKHEYFLHDYDVSVLLLEESLELGATIQPVSLKSANEDVSVGTIANVTGWGKLHPESTYSTVLQEVQIPRVSQESCQADYFEPVTSRMSCYGAAEGGKGICMGDAGSPLVVDGKLAGLGSWGRACYTENTPDAYTNIADKEINDHINSCIENFEELGAQ